MKQLGVQTDGHITLVTFNRPEKYNSFDLELIRGFADAVTAAAADGEVKGIIVTGSGKAFCTGGDLGWAAAFEGGAAAAFHTLSGHFHRAVTEIRKMEKPVIAAVNGVAAGGGFSLALACDFRVMAASAVLRQGFTSNGLSMDGGATFTLPRLAGCTRAMEIAVFDPAISAETALQWGLATRIADDTRLMEETGMLIHAVLSGSLNSFVCSKRLLNESYSTPMEQQMEKERSALAACASHRDGKEGIRAFLEKRKPVYTT